MLLHLKTQSKYLEMETDIYIIRPNVIKEEPIYLLYLLHGYTGDYSNWVRHTNIERYVADKNMIVVMPSGLNMYYTNTDLWYPYFSYYTKELPHMVSEILRLDIKKENTFIAGLSMGGYGALKAILSTDNYAKAASFSGALDLHKLTEKAKSTRKNPFDAIFSKNIKKEDDLFTLVRNHKKPIELYLSCGKDDPFLPDSQAFVKLLKQEGIKHVYYEKEGTHDWVFWDNEIKHALSFFLDK